MAIVRILGRPSLFLTFIANPNWPEILYKLYPGQTANDRPDLITYMFKLKVNALLQDIKDGCFNDLIGDVQIIEYQKRGLPHLHLLIFLTIKHRDRLLDPIFINQVISAELPTLEDDLNSV